MGAIFGVVGDESANDVHLMGQRLAHRGQNQVVWSPKEGVIFGQRGWDDATPSMSFPIAIDCQLANRDELSDLVGLRKKDPNESGDAELILELFERYGVDGLSQIRGYFSIAFWDSGTQQLVLACDQVGFKSLYYIELSGRLAFASEYKALLTLPDVVVTPNRRAIQYYLATRNFYTGEVYLNGVRPVMAGEVALWCRGKVEKRRYWQPTKRSVHRSRRDHAVTIRRALLDTVGRQSRLYSSIGVALGAGLDAAAVLAALRHVRPEGEIVSFTIGVDEDDPESIGGRLLADQFKTEHHEIKFSTESISRDLPRLVWLMEDCSAREEALLQFQVRMKASKRVQVMMGGDGADSVFGGMPRHRLVRLAQLVPLLRRPFADFYQCTQSRTSPRTWLGRILELLVYRGANYPPPSVLGLTTPATVPWPKGLNESIVGGLFPFHDFGYLEPAHEVARLAFHTPFLDPDFIDLALTIPEREKVSWWRQKILLRKAMKGLLPSRIAKRRKAIQRVRHDSEMSDILDVMADELLNPSAVRQRGLIEPSYVQALRRRRPRAAYATEQLYCLWTLISLEIWARQFLDRRGEYWDLQSETDEHRSSS